MNLGDLGLRIGLGEKDRLLDVLSINTCSNVQKTLSAEKHFLFSVRSWGGGEEKDCY